MRRSVSLVVVLTLIAGAAHAQSKRPLDHSVYDGWNRIVDQRLSDDGRWISYSLNPQDGDAVLRVHGVARPREFTVPRGREAQFSKDARWVIFSIKPELVLTREAKKEKKKPDQQPKDSLGILDLSSGEIVRIARVKSFAVPEEASGFLAYLLEPERDADKEEAPEEEEETEPAPREEKSEEGSKKKDKKDGTTLVLRNLVTGEELRFDKVMQYTFARNASWLAYVVSAKDGEGDGTYVVVPESGEVTPVMTGTGNYKSLAFDDAGEQLAFISDREDYQADQPSYVLYRWNGSGDATPMATYGSAGMPQGWWVSEHGDVEFSESGKRLFFGSAPRPEPDPDEDPAEWEEVKVDVWNWRDPLLQPMQLVNRDRELERAYTAVIDVNNGRITQLADLQMPALDVGQEGEARFALGTSDLPYRQRISWDTPRYNDYYIVNVSSGQRTKLLEAFQGRASLSPNGTYLTWWDGRKEAWFAMPSGGGEPVNLSAGIPHPVSNELHDWPMLPSSYGSAGWTENDREFLVYDRHDVWATDPTGRRGPRNVTEGIGRSRNLEFRYARLDPDAEAIDAEEPIVLRAFDRTSKRSGYATDRVQGNQPPRLLHMADYSFGSPRKADDADVVMFTRQSFQEFPDLWTSDLSFSNMRKVSTANPQMAEYLWGTSELVHWRSTDGLEVDGLLFKPDNFDPSKKYPMMVYFYEKNSDRLHSHRGPGPGSSSISVSFYVSRGYVVFIPDVHYQVGYPGESAMDCVVSGVLSVLEKGFVDPKRVGVQGHSWGGYQIAYMITQTDIFAAAEAGAPVSNMTSAYGGIRWQSGMSRMFQYEKSQSRIGGTLWEATPRYIANSPLFWADKVNTPVLMMHNDEDGAVPWYQGIEFFVALRRLGRPTWMLNYNGEAHGLRKYQNRKDWQVRMQQFFDHYLKDAPPPVWLADGVPATKKGKTLGLELIDPKPVAEKVTSGSKN